MLKGMSMWPTSRSRAPRLQLRRLAPMCMSCPSLRSPCPWLNSQVARVSGGWGCLGHGQWGRCMDPLLDLGPTVSGLESGLVRHPSTQGAAMQ